MLQCNLGFSSSEDLLGEGFAGTNVIAIRLEALGDPSSNSPEDLALLRRRRETDNDTSSQESGKIQRLNPFRSRILYFWAPAICIVIIPLRRLKVALLKWPIR